MSRKLLNNNNIPNEIIRKTSEVLKDDSLTRYDMITSIMVNEYGYKIIDESVDAYGFKKWVLSKVNFNDINKDMSENYIIESDLPYKEIIKKMFSVVDFKKLKG